MVDINPPERREIGLSQANKSEDFSFLLPFSICHDQFFNSVNEERAQSLYKRFFSPQPFQPFNDVLDLKKFEQLNIPRVYISGTQDFALPPGEFGWLPRFPERLGKDCPIFSMDADHEALLTNPRLLADVLISASD
jgi:hypothetical protein